METVDVQAVDVAGVDEVVIQVVEVDEVEVWAVDVSDSSASEYAGAKVFCLLSKDWITFTFQPAG